MNMDARKAFDNLIESVLDDLDQMPDSDVLVLGVDIFGSEEAIKLKWAEIIIEAEKLSASRK